MLVVLFRVKSDEEDEEMETSVLALEAKLSALKLVKNSHKRKKRQVLFALPVKVR